MLRSGRSKLAREPLRGYPGAIRCFPTAPLERVCTLCRTAHAKSDSLERPLLPESGTNLSNSGPYVPSRATFRDLEGLARDLLYAEQTLEAHLIVLRAAFPVSVGQERLRQLALRTLGYTSGHPQPRLRALTDALRGDGLCTKLLARHTLRAVPIPSPARMHPLPEAGPLPELLSIGELAAWLHVDVACLQWFADLHDRNRRASHTALSHYQRCVLRKRDGSLRLIEAPKQHLKHVQRQIHAEILALIPLHPAVHGFRRQRSILTFAVPHAGQTAVLRLDLQDFFPSISGPRVQALFRTLGYPEHVADLLGGLCSVTTPRRFWTRLDPGLEPRHVASAGALYARSHLPQGAPSSPALANLCALRADRRLAGLAAAVGASYTRYADDLAFSGGEVFRRSAMNLAVRIDAILREEGFSIHPHKTRLMPPGVRQHLAGLTVNAVPNLPRAAFKHLEATLTNCLHHGPDTQNREAHPDFRAHLEGRVAFATMVNPKRAEPLRQLLAEIRWY